MCKMNSINIMVLFNSVITCLVIFKKKLYHRPFFVLSMFNINVSFYPETASEFAAKSRMLHVCFSLSLRTKDRQK